jgi:8-oxo-dGTP diphosphatase
VKNGVPEGVTMERTHRISAGAIIVQDNKILLVRARDGERIFLVGPGGGVNPEEGLPDAAIREVKEETGLDVEAGKILFVEDLYWTGYRVTKVWFLCRITGGGLERTQGAVDEGIIDAQWNQRDELDSVPVYPRAIMDTNWSAFLRDNWEVRYLDIRYGDF